MPEGEERKQWVLRVMMGNRSEIKLKTKHQMAEEVSFPSPSLHETFFCYEHFLVIWKICLFLVGRYQREKIGCERVVNFNQNAMMSSSIAGEEKKSTVEHKKTYLNFFFHVISVLLIFITQMERNMFETFVLLYVALRN